MTLEELMKRIHLPQAACETLWEERISEKEYKVWKDRFYQDIKQFIREWKEIDERLAWALEFYLKLAVDTYEEYQRKGYADQVFDQTFYDITIWSNDCYKKHGVYGLEEL